MSLGDEAALQGLVGQRMTSPTHRRLTAAAVAAVRLGAMVAVDAPAPAVRRVVDDALDAGLTPEQVVEALVLLTPVLGTSRITRSASLVADALGVDLDAMYEREVPVAGRRGGDRPVSNDGGR
jgi:hypothetical protein